MSQIEPIQGTRARIAVVGAGIVGLSAARALLAGGAKVRVFSHGAPAGRASHAAAGMLAPAYEAGAEGKAHPALMDFCLAAAAFWPGFARALEAETGVGLDYRPGPAFAVGRDEADAARLERLAQALGAYDVPFERLGRAGLQAVLPQLAPSFTEALALPGDAQVDNRAALAALERAVFEEAGGEPVVVGEAGAPAVEALLADHDAVVLATGWRLPGVQPVKGAALSLAPHAGLPEKVVRWGGVYLAPKQGRVVLGATAEPGASDIDPARSDLEVLLARGAELCPAVKDAEVLERWAGVRPLTRDLAPLIGWQRPGVYVAGGHHRNGILMGPLTGALVAEHILTGETPALAAPFAPERFAPEAG